MKKIWVVDDDRSIRWVLEKALMRAQMPCRLFESAEDVVKALEAEVPAVLLSDIRMHDMSGVDLPDGTRIRKGASEGVKELKELLRPYAQPQ